MRNAAEAHSGDPTPSAVQDHMTHPRHDEILDAADVLTRIAQKEMAEAFAAGEAERASRWVELARHVGARQACRTVRR